ncbi:MAG: hypothetical protein RMI32_07430 [Candidatus Nitrosocaldus sp.]|nr:hypothetical protein [Candidatus Nitrosocaldus sp.]
MEHGDKAGGSSSSGSNSSSSSMNSSKSRGKSGSSSRGRVEGGKRPKLAVWKFASCDGCQLSLLDLEDELLELADAVEVAYFLEASRAVVKGPYDISLVEGSITTSDDVERIRRVRKVSRYLISIGACATAGGIQALRNFGDVKEFTNIVYARPEYISTLERSTPISEHVKVDLELHGCPVNRYQLLEVISSILNGKRPNINSYSVCMECKRAGNVCIMVAGGIPCMGPVTRAGCNALCPSYRRGCYSCFGPSESVNIRSLSNRFRELGMDDGSIVRVFRMFNAYSQQFREVAREEEVGTQ